jgi:ABC-2 type transport system permease protein
MDRFRSLPISSGAVLTGHVVSGVIRNLLAMGIVILLAIALGFRPTADPLEWVGAFAILGLFILMLTWGAAAFGLLVKSPEAAGSFAFVTMIFPYFSGGFVPIATLPEWVQGFAYNQPWTHIVEAIRGLLLGTPIGNHAWLAVVWCASITVLMYIAARVLFKIQAAR